MGEVIGVGRRVAKPGEVGQVEVRTPERSILSTLLPAKDVRGKKRPR